MRNPFRAAPAVDPPPLLHFVDVYWCDAAGTYLQGWAIVETTPLAELRVRIGDREVVADRSPRLDLLPHYPAARDAEHAGFSAYLPGRPGAEVSLVARGRDGTEFVAVVELPDHQLPVLPAPIELPSEFHNFPAGTPDGPILAVGIRSASAEILEARLARLAGREVVGFDIHRGFGVDVVGDAHRLSSYFPRDHFAGVYSASLVEHLAAPWLFAAECAKVLMPGGRTFHQVPWTWPTHASPTDFWRISVDALPLLFGPDLGFRTLAVGTLGTATIVPAPVDRHALSLMPTTPSVLSTWIEAEKVSDAANRIDWPYDAPVGEEIAARYPIDGLSANI